MSLTAHRKMELLSLSFEDLTETIIEKGRLENDITSLFNHAAKVESAAFQMYERDEIAKLKGRRVRRSR